MIPSQRAVMLVLSLLVFLHHALAANTVGYIAEEGSPLATVVCAQADDDVYEDPAADVIFCDDDGPWIEPVDCRGDTLFYVTTLVANAETTSTISCDGGCVKLTVIDLWPDEGETTTLYDCVTNLAGIEQGVGVQTVFWSVPDNFVTEETAGPTVTALGDDDDKNDDDKNDDDKNDDDKNDDDKNDDDDKGGPDTGLIVGAAVGGVAGLALISAAIFLGIRLGRKKAANKAAVQMSAPQVGGPGGEVSMFPGGAERYNLSQPPPTLTSGWTSTPSSPPIDSVYMVREGSGMSPVKSPYSPSPDQHYNTRPWHAHQSVHSELPNGLHAQGWASNEQHPVPYEMEANIIR